MLAVRSNERAAAAAGIDVRNTKLAGFGIAAFVAGMAGALYAYNFGSVSYSRFGALAALGLIAFAYFGGITMVSGAIIAGIGATEGLFPHAFDKWFGLSGNWALLVGGFALIITLLVNPEGIAGTGYEKKQQKEKKKRLAAEARARSRLLARRSAARASDEPAVSGGSRQATAVLSARGISVSFGGLRAVDEVDLAVGGRSARRADRSERSGQDDVHRRDLRVRALPGAGRARRASAWTGWRRTRVRGAAWPGRGSRSNCSTISPSARTWRSRPTAPRPGRPSRSRCRGR